MLEFIVRYADLLFPTVLALIAFIVTMIRTGNCAKSYKNFLEVFDLKYKTVDTRSNYVQSFSEQVKDYVLNTATNELEELPIPKNVQDKIQSFIGTSLELALEKFLPKAKSYDEYCSDLSSVPTDVIADVYQSRVVDMAAIAESMEIAEKYREEFGLSDTASYADIYAAIDKKAQDLKASINKAVDFSKVVSEVKDVSVGKIDEVDKNA